MDSLGKFLEKTIIKDIDILAFDGDFIESQAFGFLAIRSLNNLPITFSKTTGLKNQASACGGVLYNLN